MNAVVVRRRTAASWPACRSADAMQRAHEVLFYVGLGEARYRNVETYSTGMKQRIKLAQALVHDPDLLFLDEPTNGMDPKGRDEMLKLVRDLAHNKGVSLILSSHLLPDVEYACDHVVVHGQGRDRDAGADRRPEGPRRPRLRTARSRATCAVHRRRWPRRDWTRTRPTKTSCACSCPSAAATISAIFKVGRASRRAGAPSASKRADARGRLREGDRRRHELPIHDQSYRHYGGERRHARPLVGGDRVGRHLGPCSASARSWA